MFDRTRRFFSRNSRRVGRYVTKDVFNTDGLAKAKQTATAQVEDVKRYVGYKQPRRVETFENAYARMDLDETKLAQAHRYQVSVFYIFLIMGCLDLGALANTVLNSHRYLAILPLLAFLGLCLSMMFRSSFTLYRIQRRAFFPAQEWAKHPEAWFPAAFVPQSPVARPTPSAEARPSATIHTLPVRTPK